MQHPSFNSPPDPACAPDTILQSPNPHPAPPPPDLPFFHLQPATETATATAAATATPNPNPNPTPVAPPLSIPHLTPAPSNALPIWSGLFILTGRYKTLTTHMYAIPRTIPGLPPLLDLSFLPPQIQCNVRFIRTSDNIRRMVTATDSRWYVQFVLRNDVAMEQGVVQKVNSLAKVMVTEGLIFEIGWGFHILGGKVGGVDSIIGVLAGGPVWGIQRGRRRCPSSVWRATFCLKAWGNVWSVPCVFSVNESDLVGDTRNWPSQLVCDLTAVQAKRQVASGKVMRILPIEEGRNDMTVIIEMFVNNEWMFEIGHGHRIMHVMAAVHEGSWGAQLMAVCKRAEVQEESVQPVLTHGEDRRVWAGILHVRGQIADVRLKCAAVQYSVRSDVELVDGSGWCEELVFRKEVEKCGKDVVEEMNGAQWYVRFVEVDESGREKKQMYLSHLAGLLEERDKVYAIECDKPGGTQGLLYMWGLRLPPYGLSLLGVFAPS